MYENDYATNYLVHHGVKGQKHGIRNYQNPDGSLTLRGRLHYGIGRNGKQRLINDYNAEYGNIRGLSSTGYDSGLKKVTSSYDNSRLVKGINSAEGKAYNTYTKVKSKVKSGLDYNKDGKVDSNDWNSLYGTAKGKASTLYNNAKSKAKSALDKDGNGKIDAVEKVGNTASRAFNALKSGSTLGDTKSANSQKIFDKYKQAKASGDDAAADKYYAMWQKSLKGAQNANSSTTGLEKAAAKVGSTYKNVKSKLSSTYKNVSSAVADAYSNAKTYMKTKLDKNGDNTVNASDLKSVASEFVTTAKGSINDIVGAVGDKATGAVNKVLSWADSLIETNDEKEAKAAEAAAAEEEKKKKEAQNMRQANIG